ncbi:MAG: 2-amino-4-hydroxy-6-hydroxymethyldihydropteridine diphosphokinase [Fuerstiella sp.]
MTTPCALAFGGNFARSEDDFQQAIADLASANTVCRSFANVIRSAPMGASSGSEFVNSAGVFETTLAPQELLATIHAIEAKLGRRRSIHWGPRPIDIDVLFYDQQIIDTAEIVIPHPCLWYRSFVLKPLQEICPEWIHPIFAEDVQTLENRASEQPLKIKIQDQQSSLPTLQIAQEVWSTKLRAQGPDSPDNWAELFASIVIELPSKDSLSEKPRAQPQHESSRIIRCLLNDAKDENSYRQFLTDLEAALIG